MGPVSARCSAFAQSENSSRRVVAVCVATEHGTILFRAEGDALVTNKSGAFSRTARSVNVQWSIKLQLRIAQAVMALPELKVHSAL